MWRLACGVVLVGDGVAGPVPPPDLDGVVAAAAAQQVAHRVPRQVPHSSLVRANHLRRGIARAARQRRTGLVRRLGGQRTIHNGSKRGNQAMQQGTHLQECERS